MSWTLRHPVARRSGTITHQVGRKCKIQTSRADSHPKFSQTITSDQRSSGQLSETVAGTGAHNAAALQNRTQCRPTTDSALMGYDVQSPLCQAMVGPYRGKLLEFGESVLAHLPEVGKGSGNPAPKLADRWKSGVWLGKSDITDEYLVIIDGVVYARSVRRLAKHSWSEENLRAVVETPQRPKTTTSGHPSFS